VGVGVLAAIEIAFHRKDAKGAKEFLCALLLPLRSLR